MTAVQSIETNRPTQSRNCVLLVGQATREVPASGHYILPYSAEVCYRSDNYVMEFGVDSRPCTEYDGCCCHAGLATPLVFRYEVRAVHAYSSVNSRYACTRGTHGKPYSMV